MAPLLIIEFVNVRVPAREHNLAILFAATVRGTVRHDAVMMKPPVARFAITIRRSLFAWRSVMAHALKIHDRPRLLLSQSHNDKSRLKTEGVTSYVIAAHHKGDDARNFSAGVLIWTG